MIWLHLSSGQGPRECMWVLWKLAKFLEIQARKQKLSWHCLEQEPGPQAQTLKSALYSLDDEEGASQTRALKFAREWQGSIQWIGQSPFRPQHKRKNWFVGVQILSPPTKPSWQSEEIQLETLRAGGPGGQHVNKVESAVRATHLPTGLSVLAREERSQWRNKQLALARLQAALENETAGLEAEQQKQRWQQHHSLERGNAHKVFKGPDFRLMGPT